MLKLLSKKVTLEIDLIPKLPTLAGVFPELSRDVGPLAAKIALDAEHIIFQYKFSIITSAFVDDPKQVY